VNNGRAVIEALVGYKTGFNRTPKIGSGHVQASLNLSYKAKSESWATYCELFLALLYSGFLVWALYKSYWIVTPFLALFAIGFFYTSLLSLKEARAQAKHAAQANINNAIAADTAAFAKPANLLLIAE